MTKDAFQRGAQASLDARQGSKPFMLRPLSLLKQNSRDQCLVTNGSIPTRSPGAGKSKCKGLASGESSAVSLHGGVDAPEGEKPSSPFCDDPLPTMIPLICSGAGSPHSSATS